MRFKFILILLSPVFFLTAHRDWIYFQEQSKYVGELDFSIPHHQFIYTFYALEDIRIKKIESDCACLITNYTKSDLVYGNQGFIKVIFEPYKYGYFQKKLKITLENRSKKTQDHVIYLTGLILPDQEEELKTYDHTFGVIKTKQKKINLGRIKNNRILKRNLKLYNSASYSVEFVDISHPDHIRIVGFENNHIEPNSLKSLEIYYNTNRKQSFGLVKDEVIIRLNDTNPIVIPITIEAIILKDIDTLFPDLLPHLVVEDTLKDLKNTPILLPLEVSFTLKNEGKGVLTILQIIVPSDCEVQIGSENIIILRSGEKKDIHVRVNKSNSTGKQTRILTIFSDDYQKPEQKLILKFQL